MLLKEFPNIVLDELPHQPDPNKLYFLSKPLYNTVQYNDANPITIFTTKTIRKFLMSGHHKISGQFIIAINDFVLMLGEQEIRVHTIHTGSVCGNVMFTFEYTAKPNEKTLYTGQYNENGEIFRDVFLKAAQKNKEIANVYIDNTLASAITQNAVSNAAEAICNIRHEYPDYKVYLIGERLGCENLLSTLSTKYNLKVFPNLSRRRLFNALGIGDQFCQDKDAADIMVLEDSPSRNCEVYQKAYESKKICLRLITTEKETNSIGVVDNGIVYIPYAPHPSAYMLMLLLDRLKPKKVITMTEKYSSGSCSDIPEPMRGLFEVEYGEIDTTFDYGDFDYAKLNGTNIEDAQVSERSFLATSESVSSSSDGEQVFQSEDEHTPELPAESLNHEIFHDMPESNVANSPSVSIRNDFEQDGNCNIIEVIQIKSKANEKVITIDLRSPSAVKRKGPEMASKPKARASAGTNEKTPIREPQTINEPQEEPAAAFIKEENGRRAANQLNSPISIITISDDDDETAQTQQCDRNGNTIELSQTAPKVAENVMKNPVRRPKKAIRKSSEIIQAGRTIKVDGRKQLKGIKYISSSSSEGDKKSSSSEGDNKSSSSVSDKSNSPNIDSDIISVDSISIHSSPSSDN